MPIKATAKNNRKTTFSDEDDVITYVTTDSPSKLREVIERSPLAKMSTSTVVTDDVIADVTHQHYVSRGMKL